MIYNLALQLIDSFKQSNFRLASRVYNTNHVFLCVHYPGRCVVSDKKPDLPIKGSIFDFVLDRLRCCREWHITEHLECEAQSFHLAARD